MGNLAALVFWVSFLSIVYVYFGYPLVSALRARLRPRTRVRAPIEPRVSIIVIAHNEADRIGATVSISVPPSRVAVFVS